MDPIANMLVSIKNAQAVKKDTVTVPYSVVKHNIAKILAKKEFIGSLEKRDNKSKKPVLFISLKYNEGEGAISSMKRISKPGRRIYVKKDDIRNIKDKHKTGIISTSSGLMTVEDARKKGFGGEFICEVW